MNYKMVYVCSPLRAYNGYSIHDNIEAARLICRRIRRTWKDVLPIAPHLYFSQFMNDEVEEERQAGMIGGNMLLKNCIELWYFPPYDYVSEGMKKEIELAKELGLKVKKHVYQVYSLNSSKPEIAIKIDGGFYE